MTTTKKESYLVEGMSCSGCERAIQRAVSTLEGVKAASADLSNSTVSVEYNPEKITIDDIKSAVNRLGYKFVGERPVFGQREGRDDSVS